MIKANDDPDPSQLANRQKRIGYLAIPILIIGLLISAACLYFGGPIAGGIFLGIMMSSGESILHSDINPENTITVNVISDSCGATCDCTTRLDISWNKVVKKEIYRVNDACDLEIKWLDEYRFEVIDKWSESDEPVILDARDYFR